MCVIPSQVCLLLFNMFFMNPPNTKSNEKKACTTRVTKRRANKTKSKKDLVPEDLQEFIIQDRAADPNRQFVAKRARSSELSNGESDCETKEKAKRARGE